MRVSVRHREEYSQGELGELRRWLEQAYDDEPWRPEHWDDLGPGPHVVAEGDEGDLLAHACVAWVPVTIGDTTVPAGALEDGGTRAAGRRRAWRGATRLTPSRARASHGFRSRSATRPCRPGTWRTSPPAQTSAVAATA